MSCRIMKYEVSNLNFHPPQHLSSTFSLPRRMGRESHYTNPATYPVGGRDGWVALLRTACGRGGPPNIIAFVSRSGAVPSLSSLLLRWRRRPSYLTFRRKFHLGNLRRVRRYGASVKSLFICSRAGQFGIVPHALASISQRISSIRPFSQATAFGCERGARRNLSKGLQA